MSLAADTRVEAIDGPTAIGTLEGKFIPVLTRLPNAPFGFRMMGRVTKGPPGPVVKVSFENGHSVRVGADQIFFRKGMAEVRAADLRPGDALERAWDYREGYRPPDVESQRPSDQTLRVSAVVPDGEGELFAGPVHETGAFFLTCGALLKA